MTRTGREPRARDPRPALAACAYLFFHPLLPVHALASDAYVYYVWIPWGAVFTVVLLLLAAGSLRFRAWLAAVPRLPLLLLFAWLALATLSAVRAPGAPGPAREEVLELATLAAAFVLFACPWSRPDRRRLLALLSLAGAVAALLVLVQGPLRGETFYSVAGNPNAVAALLLVALPAGLARLREAPSVVRALPPALAIAGILAARSRAGAFALGMGALALATAAIVRPDLAPARLRGRAGRGVLVGALAALLLAAVLLAPRIQRALESEPRTALWAGALGLIADHPLLGVGPGRFYIEFPPYRPREYALLGGVADVTTDPHSHPLRVAAETGLPGLLVWLAFLAAVAREVARGGADPLRCTSALAAAFLLAQNLVDQNLGIPIGRFWLMALLGMAISPVAGEAPPGADSPRPAPLVRVLATLAAAATLIGAVLRPVVAGTLVYRAAHAGGVEERRPLLAAASRLLPYEPRYAWMHALAVTASDRDLRRGLAAYERLRAYAPDYAHLHLNAGTLAADLGDVARAEADFRREIALFPYAPHGHDALERLYRATGRAAEADRVAAAARDRAAELARAGAEAGAP